MNHPTPCPTPAPPRLWIWTLHFHLPAQRPAAYVFTAAHLPAALAAAQRAGLDPRHVIHADRRSPHP